VNYVAGNLGLRLPLRESGNHVLPVPADSYTGWAGVRNWKWNRVDPGERLNVVICAELGYGSSERLPAHVGFIAVKEQERLPRLVPDQVNRESCRLIAFDVIFLEEQRWPARAIVEQLVII